MIRTKIARGIGQALWGLAMLSCIASAVFWIGLLVVTDANVAGRGVGLAIAAGSVASCWIVWKFGGSGLPKKAAS